MTVKELYNYRKQNNLCCGCGKEKLTKGSRCAPCNEKNREIIRLYKLRCYKSGICYNCGKNYVELGRSLCSMCLIKDANRVRNRREKRLVTGLCFCCGKLIDMDQNEKYCIRCLTHTSVSKKLKNPLYDVDWIKYLKNIE